MRVLLIGPKFFHYVQSIDVALKSLGHEVIMHSISGYTDYEQSYYLTRIYKLGFKKFGKEYYSKQNSLFLENCRKFNPDICLILNGDLLDSTTMKQMRQMNIQIILWLMDSIQKKSFKNHLHKLTLFNKIFSFEPSDIAYLKNTFKISAVYLPIGYDSFIFNKSKGNTKNIDMLFIGALSKLRKKILNDVAKYSVENNKKICLIMPLWTNNNIFHKIRNIWHKFIFKNNYPFLAKVIQDTRVDSSVEQQNYIVMLKYA